MRLKNLIAKLPEGENILLIELEHYKENFLGMVKSDDFWITDEKWYNAMKLKKYWNYTIINLRTECIDDKCIIRVLIEDLRRNRKKV